MRTVRAVCLFLSLDALVLGGCGEGSVTDCACTITVEGETLHLGCGDTGCIAGGRYGCDEDQVMPLGRCGADLAGTGVVSDGDGGQCLAPQASCEGQGLSCCAVASDAGAVTPSCDGVSRRCCVPTGERCSSSADCCSGRPCLSSGEALRCAS